MADRSETPPAVVAAGRLLQAFVFAPLGAGVKLVEDGPAMIARARQELSNARFIGEMVVSRGAAELRQRVAPSATEVPWEQPSDSPDASDEEPDEGSAARPVPEADADVGDVVDAAAVAPRQVGDEPELGLVDYDHLPAIDIVGRLDDLSVDELLAIDAYEREHRRRRTVLGKITQLLGES